MDKILVNYTLKVLIKPMDVQNFEKLTLFLLIYLNQISIKIKTNGKKLIPIEVSKNISDRVVDLLICKKSLCSQ